MVSTAPRTSAFFIINRTPRIIAVFIASLCILGTINADEYTENFEPGPHRLQAFCPDEATVDLTDAVQNATGFLLHESGHSFPPWAVRHNEAGFRQGCICDLRPCLAFCPPGVGDTEEKFEAEEFVDIAAIPEIFTTNLTVDEDQEGRDPDGRFNFIIWEPCHRKTSYFLDPEMYESDDFYLLRNGTLFVPEIKKVEARLVGLQKFCFVLRPNKTSYTPRVCSVSVQTGELDPKLNTLKYIGALVAVPFLIATVIVYSVLPELRNIHGTTLRCYLCCLIVTYIALAIDRIPPPDIKAGSFCMFLGFTIYFFFLACFFWLNVMCVDMWWRFGGFGSLRSSGPQHDRKKFIGYSIYAWGSVTIMTAVCIGMEYSEGVPESMVRPGFKLKACWFNTNAAAALYFFGPIGITIVCNICLFIATSIKIVQHTRDTQRQLNSGDSRRHDDNRQWFTLHLKLSVIMGISWSTEVISWLWEGPKYLWLVTDMVNALQGFLIFFIFVWKRRIWKSLKKRWNELELTRTGCILRSSNSDSHPTTTISDTIPCTVSVLALEDLNSFKKQNVNQNNGQAPKLDTNE